MGTPTSGSGRHRRRIRFALPVAAAAVAALISTSASADTGPAVTGGPAVSAPSKAALNKRIARAITARANTTKKHTATAGGSAVTPKIIGGGTATIASAPWMAQLWYYDDKGTAGTGDDVGFFCGGSVISPTKILTAAHCVKGFKWSTTDSAVVTGTASLPTANADGTANLHGGTVTGVLRQWNHPSYTVSAHGAPNNDIAVLTLAAPVKATPIRMTTNTDTTSYKTNNSAKVYGWGRTTSTTDDISATLKTATLPVQSDTTCTAAYGSTDFVKGHMVCAGKAATGSDTGTTTTCNGDSGGPLVFGGRIVGVVSWGVEDCVAKGAYPVFTKASTYVGAAYAQIADSNLSYTDGKADLFARKSSTRVGYELDSKGSTLAARQSAGDWTGVNVVLQADLNRDGFQDFVYRIASSGDVYWYHFALNSAQTGGSWVTTKLFTDWRTRKAIVIPGDLTGDYLPDVLSEDSSGVLWLYPGKGNGTFGSRVRIGGGWSQYNQLRGVGDFNGDGKADLLARRSSGGDLYLYKGTGKSGTGLFSARVKVRSGWTGFNTLAAVGDMTGDGRADLVARTTSGTLYLYPGTGKATSEIFGTRKSLGTGFQQYDIFG
ncbi:trypsin-like serine protease [Streptomyces sp. NPDC101237]|uniref:trypsin-like serine protease n=1 Tax=Streptomyces sp. NPDC101237 TaxID=3366139 RepID=UPI00381EA7D2